VSTLPPLPPEWQAKVDQNYAGAVEMLTAMVSGARTDPKRNPADDADYHNTQVAMLHQWEKLMGDDNASGTRSALAAAVIALDALGWPESLANRGAIDPNQVTPRPPWWRRRTLAAWFWPFTMGVILHAAVLAVLQQLT
jgi:hypothetical protein